MAIKKHASSGTWMYDVRHPITKKRLRVHGFPTKSVAGEAADNLRRRWRDEKHGTREYQTALEKSGHDKLNLRDQLKFEVELLREESVDFFTSNRERTAFTTLRFIDGLPENLAVTELTPTHLKALADREIERGVKRSSVATYLTQFRSVLTRIRERNPVLANWDIPFYVVPREFRRKLRKIWTTDELDKVLDVLSQPERYFTNRNVQHRRKLIVNYRDAFDLLSIAAMIGARKTEVLLLEWGKVYFDFGVMQIRTLKRKGGKVEYREIPLTEELAALLRDRRTFNADRYPADETMLFPRWRTDPHSKWLYHVLKQACDYAGIPYGDGEAGLVPHGLRHTAATRMVIGGTDLVTAADILGNTPETMLKNYAHTTMDSKRTALGKLTLVRPAKAA
jgi:integrase